MQQRPLLIVAKGFAGVLAGIALWWGLAGPYDELLAGFSEPLVRALEGPPATQLRADNGYILINRTDFDFTAARPALAAGHLTANIILLTALFATNRKSLSLRNVAAFTFAALLLVVIHILAVIVNVESIYAWELGSWSARHYGKVARTLWDGATHFYTVAGSFGSAFLLWWLSGRS